MLRAHLRLWPGAKQSGSNRNSNEFTGIFRERSLVWMHPSLALRLVARGGQGDADFRDQGTADAAAVSTVEAIRRAIGQGSAMPGSRPANMKAVA